TATILWHRLRGPGRWERLWMGVGGERSRVTLLYYAPRTRCGHISNWPPTIVDRSIWRPWQLPEATARQAPRISRPPCWLAVFASPRRRAISIITLECPGRSWTPPRRIKSRYGRSE